MYNGTSHPRPLTALLKPPSLPNFVTDTKALYPFLIAYGASGAATVTLCMGVILSLPSASLSASSDLAVSASQRAALVAFYVPFLVVPALIAVDLGLRTGRALQAHAKLEQNRKTR